MSLTSVILSLWDCYVYNGYKEVVRHAPSNFISKAIALMSYITYVG